MIVEHYVLASLNLLEELVVACFFAVADDSKVLLLVSAVAIMPHRGNCC